MIKKVIFRDEVKRELLEAMFQGTLNPSQPVSLAEIARRLEVSVTPVREALSQLTETKIVSYIPNRGFIVTELSETEAIELYELIGILESSALLHSKFTKTQIRKLEKCQQNFLNAFSKEDRVYCDMQFHDLILESCTNSMMKKIVHDFRIRVFFYELEYMSMEDLKEVSDSGHNKIINYLLKGDLERASNALHENWKVSIESMNLSKLTN